MVIRSQGGFRPNKSVPSAVRRSLPVDLGQVTTVLRLMGCLTGCGMLSLNKIGHTEPSSLVSYKLS